jgi:hypothetical protein
MNNKKCEHRRIKRIFTHGRNSRPTLVCKDCDKIINRNERRKEQAKLRKKRENGYRKYNNKF